MSSLIILDFANNRISIHIPKCLNNIIALVFNGPLINTLGYRFYIEGNNYIIEDNLMLLTKGQG